MANYFSDIRTFAIFVTNTHPVISNMKVSVKITIIEGQNTKCSELLPTGLSLAYPYPLYNIEVTGEKKKKVTSAGS